MSKKPRWTHPKHVEEGALFKQAYDILSTQTGAVTNAFPSTSQAHKKARQLMRLLKEYRVAMDGEYHMVTSDEAFNRQGFVYFDLPREPSTGGVA